MSGRLGYTLLAAALVVVGGALAFRYQKPLEEKLFAKRLAEDLAPDESLKVARAFAALGRGDPAFERLGPEAKLRYLLATGFTLQELAPRAFAGKDDPKDDIRVVEEASARERRLVERVAELVRAHPRIAERFAAEATFPEIRRRAVQALGLAAGPDSLPALRARLEDPEQAVRVSALHAGNQVAMRANDTAARMAFLTHAVRVPGLAVRALDASDFVSNPAAVPVLVAYIDRPEANAAERTLAADAIRKLLPPGTKTPAGVDPAEWRAWLERVSRRDATTRGE